MLDEKCKKLGQHEGLVVSTVASQQEGSGFDSVLEQGLYMWSLHVLSASVWVFSGCSGFFPLSKTCMLSLAYTVRSWPVFDLILRRTTHFEVWPTSSVIVHHLSCSVQGGARAIMLLPTHNLMIR